MNACRTFLLLSMLLMALRPLMAQDIKETEARLKALKAQIAQYETQLKRATTRERSALRKLRELERRMTLQQQLVQAYSRKLKRLQQQEEVLRSHMQQLKEEIATLKETYRKRALHAYKYGRLHDLALLLSAESINQMLIRARYLHRFAAQRQQKVEEIATIQDSLLHKRMALEQTRRETERLLAETRDEQQKLNSLRREHQRLIAQLRRQRTSLQKELEQKRRDATALEKKLQELIAAETASQTERTRINPDFAASMEALSEAFSASKGRLPWPVDGVITESYGIRVHPVYGTKTPNPGIEIATRPGADVEAVFEGLVNRVFVMPGYGTCIMLRHGDFTTVYCNLSYVYVKAGQYVQQGQVIARAGTENEPRGSALFFALFFHEKKQDPGLWLQTR